MSMLRRAWVALLIVVSFAGCGEAWDMYAASHDSGAIAEASGNSTAPALATLANGDLALAWHFLASDGRTLAVRLQRYDAGGRRIGSENTINRASLARAGRPAIAALADGGYVVAWITPGYTALYVQRFDASDKRVGDERRVSSLALDASSEFGVAALNDGGYVLAWVAADGSVYWRRFHDAGDPDPEARLDPLESTAHSAFVAGLSDGGWVIAWTHLRPAGGGIADIYGQRFDANGGKHERLTVNSTAAAFQSVAGIAGLRSGRYAVLWTVQAPQVASGAAPGVYVQCFDAGGGRVRSQTLVGAGGTQARPDVATLKDGGYVVAWEALAAGRSDWHISAQRFDAGARAGGGTMPVSAAGSAASQQQVATAAGVDGGYAFAWTTSRQGSTSAIEVVRYGANDSPR